MTVAHGYSDPARVAARAQALGATPIGRSIEGRDLVAISIGAGERVSLVLAGIHPIEWIGIEVALGLAERLAASPPPDRRVLIVPVINVDGHAAIARDLAAGQRRYRRTNQRGVDLNRNFPLGHAGRPHHNAGAVAGIGAGPLARLVERRAGASAWSEPETAAVAALASGKAVDRAIALHAFGRMILLPWAHRGATSPRHAELLAHARRVASALPTRYRIFHTGRWPLFRPGGLELDWLTSLGALAMLIECGRGGLEARRPSTWIEPFRWYNPAEPDREVTSLIRALEPFVRGQR